MLITHAYCSVFYEGRGSTKLAPHDRVIMVKDDNSVLVHNENGIKPLNYMTGIKSTHTSIDNETSDKIRIYDSNKESLTIILHRVYSEVQLASPSEEDSGLERDGTEEQFQSWLSENMCSLLPDYTFVEREHQTGVGPVDLLAKHNVDNHPLLIEVKRVATRAAIHQVKRYHDEYIENIDYTVRPVLIALNVRPSAREFAEKKNIPWIEVSWKPQGESNISDSWFPAGWDII